VFIKHLWYLHLKFSLLKIIIQQFRFYFETITIGLIFINLLPVICSLIESWFLDVFSYSYRLE